MTENIIPSPSLKSVEGLIGQAKDATVLPEKQKQAFTKLWDRLVSEQIFEEIELVEDWKNQRQELSRFVEKKPKIKEVLVSVGRRLVVGASQEDISESMSNIRSMTDAIVNKKIKDDESKKPQKNELMDDTMEHLISVGIELATQDLLTEGELVVQTELKKVKLEEENKKRLDLSKEWDEKKYGEKPYEIDDDNKIKKDDEGNPIPLSFDGEKYIKELRLTMSQLSNDSNETSRFRTLSKLDKIQKDFVDNFADRATLADFSVFQSELKTAYDEVTKQMEQRERVGTIEAFFNFMIKTDGKEWKIDGKMVKDMEEKDIIIQKLIKDPSNENPGSHDPKNPFNDAEVEKWKTSFEQWFRHWWVGELNDISSTNQNSFISGLTQIDAPLTVMGLLNNIPIISILGAMDTSEGKWGEFVGETIGQLQTMSAIHNRERLYARAKNISPEKVLEVMLGIAEQVAGRGESLAISGKSWKTLFSMKELEEGKETFGDTFKKALALYLSMDVNYLGGDLSREVLESYGFSVSDEMIIDNEVKNITHESDGRVTYFDPEKGGSITGSAEIVIKNIFPIENQQEHHLKIQRDKMIKILIDNGSSKKAAMMAEKLAFNAFEVGFGGADVDAAMSAKEAMYKLVHTRIYRTKYIKQSKKAGSPLNLEDIDRLAMTYFDMIKLPLSTDGGPIVGGDVGEGGGEIETKTFRSWILDDKKKANEIPIDKCINRPDYYYYDGVLQWGTKMWGYLNDGLGVPWENVLRRGDTADKGEVIDPEYINILQDAYKYTGYWVGGLSADEIAAFIQPFDTNENSAINVYIQRFNEDKIDLPKLKGKVTQLVFRRMVFRELQELGEKYNPAVKNMNIFKPVIGGRRLDTHDLARIHYMLVEGVSKKPLIDADGLFSHQDFDPLFDEEMVLSMLYDAGLTTFKPTLKNIGDVLGKIAELAALKKAGRH